MKKAAVIGLGDISKIHIPIIELSGYGLCGGLRQQSGDQKAAVSGTAFYTDYHEMVEKERPDCVHVCLPHYLHYPVTKELVEMGCSVFCEKPVALNTEEAERFVRLEEAHPEVRITICLQNRLNESVELLKKLIKVVNMGRWWGREASSPGTVRPSIYRVKPWRGSWITAGGGCMINQFGAYSGPPVLFRRKYERAESLCKPDPGLRHRGRGYGDRKG